MYKLLLFVCFCLPAAAVRAQAMPDPVKKVSNKYACGACHAVDMRLVGPSWKTLAAKGYTAKKMGQLIRKPKPGNWPDYPPMTPIAQISDEDVKVIADWLATLQ